MTLKEQTDSALLEDFARRGSQGAFRILTERYSGLVYGAAYRRTGRRGLAEEVAQNVFAVLARKAGALARPEMKLAAWLHRAAVLEASRALRKESTRQRIMDDYFHQADVLSAEDAAVWQAVLPELDSALDSLPEHDRHLVFARFFEDRSYQELSHATGRSVAALMQQQHRALERLGLLLKRRGAAAPIAVLAAGLGATAAPSSHAAPAGLAASLAGTAPTAASSLGAGQLLLHSIDIAMQTHTRIALGAAVAACFLAGSGAFWVGKSQAEAHGESRLAAARQAAASAASAAPAGRGIPSSLPATPAPAALDIRAKLDQAVAGWRANSEYKRRLQALEIVDALSPEEVPVALEVLASVKEDYGLHLALGKRIAMLWGAQEPEPALKWLVVELPREHRGEPIQMILTDWSRRDPRPALAWWQAVNDSLDYPIPQDQFERFEHIIYSGWAAHDPVSLVGQLPDMKGPDEREKLEGTVAAEQLMGLATAAVDPTTRAATLAAIAGIANEGTRATAAQHAALMMNVADAAAGREFLLSLSLSDKAMKGAMLGEAAIMGVLMQQQSAAEAVAWLRSHTDEETTRKAVDSFLQDYHNDETIEIASELKAALEKK